MSDVLHAALRGAVAAAAMTGMRTLTVSLGLVQDPPPEAIAERGRLLEKVPPERRRAAIELAHWTYGAKGGALFGMLPEGLRRRAWSGPLYGLALWVGFEAGIAPLLGLRHAQEPRPAERVALLADHLLYGYVLSGLRRESQR
ncbi:MAG: hypothetical protein QOG77_2683 [Solirubrobacteraceae bacterium]|jgi:hypothetical protein|nr:hypothetical protein [Solirubrobacteraceae bacterium]